MYVHVRAHEMPSRDRATPAWVSHDNGEPLTPVSPCYYGGGGGGGGGGGPPGPTAYQAPQLGAWRPKAQRPHSIQGKKSRVGDAVV